jgi:MscS family membrane protein
MRKFIVFLSDNNTWENWTWFFCIILASALVGRLLVWIEKKFLRAKAEKTTTHLDDLMLNVFQMPFVCGLVLLGIYIAIQMLVLPTYVYPYIKMAFTVLLILDIAWVLNRFIKNVLDDYFLPYIEHNKNSKLDINVIKAIQKISSGVIWIVAVITVLTQVGVDVAALLTTLGVGGIAFALAAQDTIKNLFGGFTIFVDKPFKIGDRIQVAGFDGTVEDIGMRSTRIRTLAGRLVTIPNYKIVDSEIENVTAEDARKITLNLGLTYDTTPEAMQEAMDWLKNLPDIVPAIKNDTKVAFTTYGDFSLGITFIYYIKRRSDVFDTQSEVNLAILKQFNAKGWNFAFPTQTIYTRNE